jgi:hypothetical protein
LNRIVVVQEPIAIGRDATAALIELPKLTNKK